MNDSIIRCATCDVVTDGQGCPYCKHNKTIIGAKYPKQTPDNCEILALETVSSWSRTRILHYAIESLENEYQNSEGLFKTDIESLEDEEIKKLFS